MTTPRTAIAAILAAAALGGCGSTSHTSSSPPLAAVTITAPAATPPTLAATQPPPAAPAPSSPPGPPVGAHGAAKQFAKNYILYSYGFLPLSAVEPASPSLHTFLSQGRHVPSTPSGPRPRLINLKFAPLAGGYTGVVATYSTSSSVSAFAFDVSNKTGRWQAERLEG